MLSDKLGRTFKMNSTQAVAKLQEKIETMSFKEGGDWEKNVSDFLSTFDELGAQNQTIKDNFKETKCFVPWLRHLTHSRWCHFRHKHI